MAHKKRKRRLGHITDAERIARARAKLDARSACHKKYGGRDKTMCLEGVDQFDRFMRARGF